MDPPRPVGGKARHGRATLFLRSQAAHPEVSVGAEWAFFWPTSTGASFTVEGGLGDYDWSAHVSVWRLFAVWGHLNGVGRKLSKRLRPKSWPDEREISVSFHNGTLFWCIWCASGHWSKDEGWRHSSFNFVDFVLGPTSYSERELSTTRTKIPMPEGAYPATVKLVEAIWRRPRWPRAVVRRRAHIEPDIGVPEPGKGTTSYNIDDTSVSSMTTLATSVPEAVAEFVKSVLVHRERYGGPSWEPEVTDAEAVG